MSHILNGQTTLWHLRAKLHKSTKNGAEISSWVFHRWMNVRNIDTLFDVWKGSGFEPRLEPVILNHGEKDEGVSLSQLQLVTRETCTGSLLQYKEDGRNGYPVGIFKTIQDATKFGETDAKLKTILMCIGGVYANDGTHKWHVRSGDHVRTNGRVYKLTNMLTKRKVELLSVAEVSDYLGETVADINDRLSIVGINEDQTVYIDEVKIESKAAHIEEKKDD